MMFSWRRRPKFHRVSGPRRSRFPWFRPALEELEWRLVPANLPVTTTADDGAGSLRQAIQAANLNTGTPDTIVFDIGSGVQTINVGSTTGLPLPAIATPVIIDGTAPADQPTQVIELNGTAASSTAIGLTISAGGSTVRRLVINGFAGAGIELTQGGGNLLAGNLIGTDPTGTQPLPNGIEGVLILDSANNQIGGSTSADRNIISGNGVPGLTLADGLLIQGTGSTGNVIQGNYIGTDATGAAALPNAGNGIHVEQADHTLIGGPDPGAGNLISGNALSGLSVSGSDSITVQGNLIGTDATGFTPLANQLAGVLLSSSTSVLVGGTSGADRNVISGNKGDGLDIDGAGAVKDFVGGNFIGVNIQGGTGLGNGGSGVVLSGGATGDVIGGSAASVRNVISGNQAYGVQITGTATSGNFVQGNFIGTDSGGTTSGGPALLENHLDGVDIFDSPNNVIGGDSPAARNVITGNLGVGVHIQGAGATGNQVQANFIGPYVTDTGIGGNFGSGVLIEDASDNLVGGTTDSERNIISFNGTAGVQIQSVSGPATNNLVEGNFIGVDVTGTQPQGNAFAGVYIEHASGNTVGGVTPAARNIISANSAPLAGLGVFIQGSPTTAATDNVVTGNYIGTDVTGTQALGNLEQGVKLFDAAQNTIGGTTPGAGNLISGNMQNGILISDLLSTGNVVQGNRIGTQADGTGALGNQGDGVRLEGTSNNLIGGTASGAGNVIAFNTGSGVHVLSGAGNGILGNSIFSNGQLGIKLEPGANQDQAAPVLSSVVSTPTGIEVQGTITGAAGTSFTLEIFSNPTLDSSGAGEGQTLLFRTPVMTDSNGVGSFTITIATPVPAGQFVTATVTDPANNTSQFSNAVKVPAPEGTPGTPNERFVSEVYRALLNRQVDAGGLAGWSAALDLGLLNRTQVAYAIETSLEARTDQVEGLYQKLLLRPADPGGLSGWLGLLGQGATLQQVEAGIIGSPEYSLLHGGAGASSFVTAAYQDILGRTPAPGEVTAGATFLAASGSRGLYAGLLLSSAEAATERVQSYYATYLGRGADPAGLAAFVGALRQGMPDEVVQALILGSDEYFAGR
jgi:titin